MTTTAVVTGATQGLGRALVEGLAGRVDRFLLTGRDPDRTSSVAAEIGVEGRVLDVTSTEQVRALADELGSVDLVVSNASSRMSPDVAPSEQVDAVVETNNLGAHRMLRSFGPILRPGGRFLVVASSFGTVGHLDERVRPLLAQPRDLAEVERVVRDWQRAVHDGTAEERGWPHWLNIPSKVMQVAAVRAVARQRRDRDLADGTLLAAVCPGLIDTDASRPWFQDMSQAQSPAEAAAALLDLLTGPVRPEHHGELVRFGRVLPWPEEVAPEAHPAVVVRRAF